jgi:hypothetical protein
MAMTLATLEILLAATLMAGGTAVPQFTLSETGLRSAIVGTVMVFPNGTIAVWHTNGQLLYKPIHTGRVLRGRYSILHDRVCIDIFAHYGPTIGEGWANQSCFRMTVQDGSYMLLNKYDDLIPLTIKQIDPQASAD